MLRQRVQSRQSPRSPERLRFEVTPQRSIQPQRRVFVGTKVSPPVSVMMAYEPSNREKALDVLGTVGLLRSDLEKMDISVRHVFADEHGFSAELPERLIGDLRSHSGVEIVEPVRLFEVQLHDSVQVHDVPMAWSSGYDGSEVTIAILDTGVDYKHPDFGNRVDLTKSYNFTQESTPSDIADRHGHGTHVAGIVGGSATASGAKLFKGIAPNVRVIALKVFDKNGQGYGDDIAAAVHRAVDLKVDVINFSGGHLPSIPSPWVYQATKTYEELSFEAAMSHGIPTVISAGNEGTRPDPKSTVTIPATSDVVISVGSVGKNKSLSSFSSQGYVYRANQPDVIQTFQPGMSVSVFDKPDVVAVGGEISREDPCPYTFGVISAKSTQLHPSFVPCITSTSYLKCSGTSQAAPHVTGMIALLMNAVGHLKIDLTDQRAFVIKNILESATEDLGLPETQQGRGLVKWPRIFAILSQLAQNPEMVNRYRIR